MERAFLQDRLTKNPYQDPMGNDAHQGLERWLDKFHQPSVPNYTIITDPEYYVFLWFHNAIGNLIECPYLQDGYVSKLDEGKEENSPPAINYSLINSPLNSGIGIQSGSDTKLPKECVDLTPFVRQAQLPEIKPANAEPIQTLFGATTAGSFSPYASDGQSSITLQMVDTEFSILDSLFYPWMKDINSPWWYRPDKVYTEWATPYPMATLEVQRPRMRYRESPNAMESRKDAQYTYYSYKYIGVKPTSYNAFEVNGGGVSNLLRSLTLSCDMCLVDLTGDVAGSAHGSTNLGNRTNLFFEPKPNIQNNAPPVAEEDESQEQTQPDTDKEIVDANAELDKAEKDLQELIENIEQQGEGDMPGEDEPEWISPGDMYYDEDEYIDPFGDDRYEDESEDEDVVDEGEDFFDTPKSFLNMVVDFVKGLFNNSDTKDTPEEYEDEVSDDEEAEIILDKDAKFALILLNETDDDREQIKQRLIDKIQADNPDMDSDEAELTAEQALKDAEEFTDRDSANEDFNDYRAKKEAFRAQKEAFERRFRSINAKYIHERQIDDENFAQEVYDTMIDVGEYIANKSKEQQGWICNDDYTNNLDVKGETIGGAVDIPEIKIGLQSENSDNSIYVAQYIKKNTIGVSGTIMSSGIKTFMSNQFQTYLQQIQGLNTIQDHNPLYVLNNSLINIIGKYYTSFGVATNTPSEQDKYSTTSGGVFDKVLSPVFSFTGNIISNASDILGKLLLEITTNNDMSESQYKNSLKQIIQLKRKLSNACIMSQELNQSLIDITSSMDLVGRVIQSAAKNGLFYDTENDDNFGNLINRIIVSHGAKSTPIECFVGLLTKQNAKNSILI